MWVFVYIFSQFLSHGDFCVVFLQGMNTNDKNHHDNINRSNQKQFKKTQIATLQIPGYRPEDISATTLANRLTIQGKHICDCHEKCTEREFQRGLAIPRNVNPASLEAKLNKDGELTISGSQYSRPVEATVEHVVAIEGDGSFTPRSKNIDPSCGGTRGGFKLKKMNKRTGEIVEDFENYKEMDYRTFEDEVDEDGVTMEVLDY